MNEEQLKTALLNQSNLTQRELSDMNTNWTSAAVFHRPYMYFGPSIFNFINQQIDLIVKDVNGQLFYVYQNNKELTFKILNANDADWYSQYVFHTYLIYILDDFKMNVENNNLEVYLKLNEQFSFNEKLLETTRKELK